MANHCSKFIDSPNARTGILDGNPIHKDMVFAAKTLKLAFIVNVVLDENKKVIRAYAGTSIRHTEKDAASSINFPELTRSRQTS